MSGSSALPDSVSRRTWSAGLVRTVLGTIALGPRNIGIGFMLLWRRFVSPLYGDVCRFYPTCSEYAVVALQRHGLVRGGTLVAWRLARCNPFFHGGMDPVPQAPDRPGRGLTRHGFVICTSTRED